MIASYVAVAIIGIEGATPAASREWPSAPFQGQPTANPPCSCRGPAVSVEVGQQACLATPSGGRRATCVLVLNNTSWEIGAEPCNPRHDLTN